MKKILILFVILFISLPILAEERELGVLFSNDPNYSRNDMSGLKRATVVAQNKDIVYINAPISKDRFLFIYLPSNVINVDIGLGLASDIIHINEEDPNNKRKGSSLGAKTLTIKAGKNAKVGSDFDVAIQCLNGLEIVFDVKFTEYKNSNKFVTIKDISKYDKAFQYSDEYIQQLNTKHKMEKVRLETVITDYLYNESTIYPIGSPLVVDNSTITLVNIAFIGNDLYYNFIAPKSTKNIFTDVIHLYIKSFHAINLNEDTSSTYKFESESVISYTTSEHDKYTVIFKNILNQSYEIGNTFESELFFNKNLRVQSTVDLTKFKNEEFKLFFNPI